MSRRENSEPLFEPYDQASLANFRRHLKSWYAKRARDLPWRNIGEPYRVWISEIMLQQTTVATVVPYFERFTRQFPTIHDLARAEQDEVLRHWEGLGYYSRARNIHKTAKLLVEQSDGVFPQTTDELTALPGIGRYTAGAIMSFAFDRPGAIVEANTLRLYSRLLGFEENPRASHGQKVLWAFAEHLLPRKNIGPFNQSLMDLGSTVCTPNDPDCGDCPLLPHCRAASADRQHAIPIAAQKQEITSIIEVSVAIQHEDRFLLRRYPEGQRWAGLWDFVRFPLNDAESLVPADGLTAASPVPRQLIAHIEKSVNDLTGGEIQLDRFLKELRHSVTRYRISLLCFLASTEKAAPDPDENMHWVPAARLDDYPLSTTGRKLAVLVQRNQPTLF
ncbi:MAG: A/G-specific adenine glycosylase [Rhodopirellula sp.]|nr:A/G-specific adenine glycosylase [Rhodopirellula sp.]